MGRLTARKVETAKPGKYGDGYGAERVAYSQRVVRRGGYLGAYMQAQIASEEERRQAQHFRKPELVMTETASMQVWRTGECNAASTVVRIKFPVGLLASAEGFGLYSRQG